VYRDPASVAERVAWALGARPRLALDARAQGALGSWIRELTPSVERDGPQLLRDLAGRLEEESG
jgi:hypothetical protein